MKTGNNERQKIAESDREHRMRCPDCGEWFDMRDLTEVVQHEHWLSVKPTVTFSHARKKGKQNEIYIKWRGRMITLRQKRPAAGPRENKSSG